MSTYNNRLQYLVNQYLYDKCTPEELEELWQHIRVLKDETPLQSVLQDLWQRSKAGNDTPSIGWESVLQKIYDKANPYREEHAVIPLHRRRVVRWIAAAAIVLLLGAGTHWWLSKPPGSTEVVSINTTYDVKSPQTNRATVALANGKMVYLDSAADGSLTTQGNVQLVKLADGQIEYNGSANEMVYNTLINPKGSKVINMRLSDGSRIWLNAGSSITYPVAFVGKERRVTINGEGYFEVSNNSSMPFSVSNGTTEVQVLGTHFNINAYNDEPDVKVTLLEGAVKVGNNMGMVNINPGEQARIAPGRLPQSSGNINLEQVMAWRNGLFSFAGADIKTVMRQLARWYDIDIKYEGQIIAKKFRGEITRDLTLSQLMNGLRGLGIQFRIEGRTMIVMER